MSGRDKATHPVFIPAPAATTPASTNPTARPPPHPRPCGRTNKRVDKALSPANERTKPRRRRLFVRTDFAPNAGNAGKLAFDPATQSWKSTGGLVYGQGSAQGNRVLHVLEHLSPDPSKPLHTVFNVERNQLIGLLDEAWAARQGTGVLQANGNRVFEIPMGRAVGPGGETTISIIVRDGTTNVITAYPIP
jgi:hypothetical protein